MCLETGYSCIATKGACKDSSCFVDIFQRRVNGYKDVSTDIEQALMLAAAQQPVSTAIEADQCSFKSCSSGVLIASRGVRTPQLATWSP